MAKADHMLSILWMLKQRKRTAGELAEELEISIRSVYRYIDALCASGVPLTADAGPGGGYSLPVHFNAAPLFFDEGERRAIVQAASFARGTGYPYVDALDRAIAKLKRYSNEAQRQQMQQQESGIETLHSPSSAPGQWIEELENCSAEGCTLSMDYRKGNGNTSSSRLIDPYGLVLWKGQWYLAAYCHLRGEIRSFRVDRITGLHRTDSGFIRPEGFSAREFLLRGLLPGGDELNREINVVIAANEGILNDLCSHWMFGHTLIERTAGQARFLLDETSLSTFAPYFLLPYGKALTILDPPDLKQRIAAIAGELAEYYKH